MLCLCLLTHSLFISFFLFTSCTVHLIYLFFPNSMFTPLLLFCLFLFIYIFFYERAFELSGEIALKNKYYYYYYYYYIYEMNENMFYPYILFK